MKRPWSIEIGRWGEEFYVTEDGRCGVTDCNGDRVDLDAEQWREVVKLLAEHLPLPVEELRSRHASVPGRMTFTVLEKKR